MKVTEKQTERIFLMSITLVGLITLICLAIDPLLQKPNPNTSQGLNDSNADGIPAATYKRLAQN